MKRSSEPVPSKTPALPANAPLWLPGNQCPTVCLMSVRLATYAASMATGNTKCGLALSRNCSNGMWRSNRN